MIPDFEQLPNGMEVQFYLVPLIGGSIICMKNGDVKDPLSYLEPICWLDAGQKLSSAKLGEFLDERA